MKKLSPQEFDKSILPWIGKTGKMLYTYMGEKFRKHNFDLSVEQLVILKILHEEDGRPQNDMAIVTERNKSTLTRVLDGMENKHLVTRIPDKDDKRVKRVYLTKHGRQYFQSTAPIVQEAMTELQKGLTKTEIKTLISILKKVQGNINF